MKSKTWVLVKAAFVCGHWPNVVGVFQLCAVLLVIAVSFLEATWSYYCSICVFIFLVALELLLRQCFFSVGAPFIRIGQIALSGVLLLERPPPRSDIGDIVSHAGAMMERNRLTWWNDAAVELQPFRSSCSLPQASFISFPVQIHRVRFGLIFPGICL